MMYSVWVFGPKANTWVRQNGGTLVELPNSKGPPLQPHKDRGTWPLGTAVVVSRLWLNHGANQITIVRQ